MKIVYAKLSDLSYLNENDSHITQSQMEKKILDKRILLLQSDKTTIGFLRFGFYWDEIPVMNMLKIQEFQRGKGLGRKLVEYWEQEMKKQGYSQVMTSTQQDEEAQYFYRKLGYTDIGSFRLPDDEADELILHKKL